MSVASTVLLLGGCQQDHNQYVQPPPPEVTVSTPLQRDYVEQLEFTGTLAAVETVDLEARVTGFLEDIRFADGDLVEKDQLLFVIDPKPFEAALKEAKAAVEIHKAEIVRAQTEYERNRKLFAKAAASQADVVRWKAELQSAEGRLAAAEADVAVAELNLGYTRVRTPFSGHINRRQVDIGNLVGPGRKTLLATVTRDDSVYVYFSVSERDMLRVRARSRPEGQTLDESRVPLYKQVEMRVDVGLANEKGFPHRGSIDYADPAVDTETGTLTARGIIPNEKRALVAGMFVRVRLPIGRAQDALMVPEGALGVNQGGRFVLVVGEGNSVEARPVVVGQQVDSFVVVDSGLEASDRIVVNGLQHARPGIVVTPVQSQTAPADSGAAETVEPAKSGSISKAESG